MRLVWVISTFVHAEPVLYAPKQAGCRSNMSVVWSNMCHVFQASMAALHWRRAADEASTAGLQVDDRPPGEPDGNREEVRSVHDDAAENRGVETAEVETATAKEQRTWRQCRRLDRLATVEQRRTSEMCARVGRVDKLTVTIVFLNLHRDCHLALLDISVVIFWWGRKS